MKKSIQILFILLLCRHIPAQNPKILLEDRASRFRMFMEETATLEYAFKPDAMTADTKPATFFFVIQNNIGGTYYLEEGSEKLSPHILIRSKEIPRFFIIDPATNRVEQINDTQKLYVKVNCPLREGKAPKCYMPINNSLGKNVAKYSFDDNRDKICAECSFSIEVAGKTIHSPFVIIEAKSLVGR